MFSTLFSHKNQNFRTTDLLLLILLVGGVGSFVGVILAQGLQDDRPVRTQAVAENLAQQIQERILAYQLSASSIPQTLTSGRRLPASEQTSVQPPLTEGQLGNDAWGHPFHYVVRKSSDRRTRVLVWSNGANGRDDSNFHQQANFGEDKPLTGLQLGGDDIGHVVEFKTSL